MAAPDPGERKLIEHCKNYIVACGVLRGIQYENIASMQDAMKKIADAYQVDLTTGEGRKKFQEGCRKAAYEYLEEEGIIEKDDVLGLIRLPTTSYQARNRITRTLSTGRNTRERTQ